MTVRREHNSKLIITQGSSTASTEKDGKFTCLCTVCVISLQNIRLPMQCMWGGGGGVYNGIWSWQTVSVAKSLVLRALR